MGEASLLAALAAGFLLARLTVPVGVSGAVFLLPLHLWVLDVAPHRVAPTTLLHNVIALPSTILRHRAAPLLPPGAPGILLASVLGGLTGTLMRWSHGDSPDAPRIATSLALVLVGAALIGDRRLRHPTHAPPAPSSELPRGHLVRALALVTGTVGGISGIGGGSLLAPALVAAGGAVTLVAPLALRATWLTSASALALGLLLPGPSGHAVLPVVPVAVATGLGGLLGTAWALRRPLQMPEQGLRRLLGIICLVLGAAQTLAVLC